ncbi:MAG: hypothetical protein K9N53_15365 [Candidatus Marinimicrobia bacterium]|nr:hypothetical protein [Candidatus Neomarinimicrobiota bacterium]MCF7830340.1 hypothetical protein [Candidatus Neomarinimicrobiota bacterium]
MALPTGSVGLLHSGHWGNAGWVNTSTSDMTKTMANRNLSLNDFNLSHLVIIVFPVFDDISKRFRMFLSHFGSGHDKRCILTNKCNIRHAVQALECGS